MAIAGKDGIRFKRLDTIPYNLMAELCSKITVEYYLSHYDEVPGHRDFDKSIFF